MALSGALGGAILILSPLLFVHRGFHGIADRWQELVLLAIYAGFGGAASSAGANALTGAIEVKKQRLFFWGVLIFFLLYVSCSALCPKIHFGDFNAGWWRTVGLLVVCAGLSVQLWAVISLGRFHSVFVTIQSEHKLVRTGPYKWLRHPSYLGALIAMTGIPIVFGSWFPLLALPGAFVILRWRMEDEEKMLSEYFGNEFQQYKHETRRIIPFLY